MTVREMIEAASEAQPALMQKTAEAVALLEQMDTDFADEVKQDWATIAEVAEKGMASIPKEKLAGSGISGTAAFGAAVGTTLVAGLGTAIASDLYDAARKGLTKGVNFRRIMKANPELAKNYDGKRLKDAFSTLHNYAPDFTSDPTMGGSLLKQMAELEGSEHTLIQQLIQSRKNLSEAKAKQFSPGSMYMDIGGGKKDDRPNPMGGGQNHYHLHTGGGKPKGKK